ncbi:hypothetical protein ACIQUM_21095 [Amycolatopsis azurea]|uniref:hypothetical protein n=1 Tax=Amycolatopsis azurea TaxID=36819 RepID=UPI0037FD43D0
MTELRRWALAAAAAVPLSLVSAGLASADPGDGPGDAGFVDTSITYAGIGGAGTFDSSSGSDHHGFWWTEDSAVVAGPTGAAVVHTEESGSADEPEILPVDDKPGRPSVTHGKRPVAHTDADEAPARHRPSKAHRERKPHHTEVAYAESTKTADVNGATSSHVASQAGDDYAAYEAADLSAGPEGAVSEGVQAVAVPELAHYHKWYTAAGDDGAVTHEVSAVAATEGWSGHHHHRHHGRTHDHR